MAMIGADGSGFQELTSGLANNAFPSFSPDGNRIVYRTFSSEGHGLRLMNLATKAANQPHQGIRQFSALVAARRPDPVLPPAGWRV